jgi:hypothetical protein
LHTGGFCSRYRGDSSTRLRSHGFAECRISFMRFRLRTLLILLALAPLVLWAAWLLWQEMKPNQGFFAPEAVDYGDGRGWQPVDTKK